MYIFIGGSITSREAAEAKQIAERIGTVCRVLDRLEHRYDVDILTNTAVHKDAKAPEIKIPRKYLKAVTPGLVSSIRGLRMKNDPHGLTDKIASYKWSLDLLEKAGACIWDVTKSSSGSGFEIATALAMRKPCLVLFDRPTVSTTLSGCTSRLLVVRQWNDKIEQTIEQFIKKAEQGLDQSLRFNVSQEMSKWLPQGAAARGFENVSDYLRFLIEQDHHQLNQLEEK
ncbi:hypothetical protein L0337_01990 [candidate division KSB1 bacterium]|nr:hypothetical protein [candidate division KSB1 bacterium]